VAWTPGEWREARALEGPYVDVPDHLANFLTGWLCRQLTTPAVVRHVALVHRIPVADPATDFSPAQGRLIDAAVRDSRLMLNMIETVLTDTGWVPGRARDLESILAAGGSAYTVRNDELGLEMRVLPEARDAVKSVIAAASSATSVGPHLAGAWNAAFSISPDPVKSYSESIKAVEAAAAPVLTPNDSLATLGKLIGHLAANIDSWHMAVPDGTDPSIATVLAMMRTLWDGQTSRHGGTSPTMPETVESAQAAIFIATALAQWFGAGLVRS
jgi:hypothetical protein